MDKRLLKKHGINPERLQKKIEISNKNKKKKEQEQQLKREALLNEVLQKYAFLEDDFVDKKVTYEDIVVREYKELEDLLKNLTIYLKGAPLDDNEKLKVEYEIESFSKMKEKLIKESNKILVKHNVINK